MGSLITLQSLASQTLLDENKPQILWHWNKEENGIEV